MQDLHEVATALLGERGDVQPDHGTVVRGREPEIGGDYRLLDRFDEVPVEGGDDDEPRLRRGDRREGDEGGRRAVGLDFELLHERGRGTAGPDGRDLVFESVDRLSHPRLGLDEELIERHLR